MAYRSISMKKIYSDSWERMKQLLFRPFRLERWLVLGFCAWIIMIGSGGGSGPGNFGGRGGNVGGEDKINWESVDWVLNGEEGSMLGRLTLEMGWDPGVVNFIFYLSIFLIVAGVVIGLLIYWLRCRFEFIFLDNLTLSKHQVVAPWKEFRVIGNSYFGGSLLLTLIACGIIFLTFGLAAYQGYDYIRACAAAREFLPYGEGRLAVTVGSGILGSLMAIVWAYYSWFWTQLLIPIMYRDRLRFLEGLEKMNRIFLGNFFVCLLYWLLMMVTVFVFVIVIMAAGVMTCCLLLIPLMIPYINAVVLLPMAVFFRLLGVEFLNQLDPVSPDQAIDSQTV